MACNCIAEVNKLLAPANTRLHQPLMMFSGGKAEEQLFVETEQIEKGRGKKKATAVFARHCPFCGVKITVEDEANKPTMN